jgi:uncharacterized membrane protein YhaH (DUF805 family)
MFGFLAGRMGRRSFWLLVLANFVAASIVQFLMMALRHQFQDGLQILLMYPDIAGLLYIPAFVASSLRLHDIGRRGTLSWVALALTFGKIPFMAAIGLMVALVGQQMLGPHGGLLGIYGGYLSLLVWPVLMLWLAYLCAQPGDVDANSFGPPPGQTAAPTPPSHIPSVTHSLTPAPSRGGARGFGRRGT